MSQTPHAEADMCLGEVIYHQYQCLRHPVLKLTCVLVKWSIINITVSDTPCWSWHVSWCSDLSSISISLSQISRAEADIFLGVVIYHLSSISMSQIFRAEANMCLGVVIYHLLSISQTPRAEADMFLGVVIYYQYQCLRYPTLKLICVLVKWSIININVSDTPCWSWYVSWWSDLLSISISQTPRAEANMCLGEVIYYQYQCLRHPTLKLICVLV